MGGTAVALAIKVTADARQASQGLGSATQQTSKLGQAGKVAGRLLAVGLLAAVGAAVAFTNAAAADAQAQAKLAATAEKVAGATKGQVSAMEDWITAQGKALGVTDDELRPALEKFLTVTKDVGESQKLAALAMDISARTGKSLSTVTQSLATAQTKGAAGLAKYGVQTKDANGKVKSLAAVQKDLAKVYSGAAADAADTQAGKAKIMAVQMDELKEKIGTGLLPIMGKLTTAGMAVVDWMTQNTGAALAIVGVLGSLLAVVKLVSIATQVWSAITKLAAAAQAIFNAVMSANPIGLIALAIVALVAVIVLVAKKTNFFQTIWAATWGTVTKIFGGVVDFIRAHWRLIISIIGGPIGLAVALVTKHWDTIKAGVVAVIGFIRDKWPAIKALITAPFNAAEKVISTAWDAITSGFRTAKETLGTIATQVQTAVKGAFDAIAGAIQAVIDKVQGVIDKIAHLKDIGGGLLDKVGLGKVSARGSVAGGGVGTLPPKTAPSNTVTINIGVAGDPRAVAREIELLLRRYGIASKGQAA